MQPVLIGTAFVAAIYLQALLLPITADEVDIAGRAARVGAASWLGLVTLDALIAAMGYWVFAGAPTFTGLEHGKRTLFAGTLLATLPLWAFMNGLLGGHITDLIPLWLFPISILVAGAAMSKDWKDMVRALVIGFGIPVASLLFLATFIGTGS